LHITSKYFVQSRLHVVGVNKLISVCFKPFATIVVALIGPAKFALLTRPRVLQPLEPNMARLTVKPARNRMLAVGVL
jgi:hypothetical protein